MSTAPGSRSATFQSGYSPSASASQVLADGRVLMEGGEYNFGKFALTNLGAIYDPARRPGPGEAAQGLAKHRGFSVGRMPNGTFLLGDKLHKRRRHARPKTMKWTLPAIPARTISTPKKAGR